jgi:hypothetical protein
MQPLYMPWLAWYERVYKSDIVVIFDTAQYVRQDFINRNRIRVGDSWKWLSVPTTAHNYPAIKDVMISQGYWGEAHSGLLRQAYHSCPWFYAIREVFDVLSFRWTMLTDLQIELIRLHCSWLNIIPDFVMASNLICESSPSRKSKTSRLVDICLELGATTYYTGDASRDYLEESCFAEHGIAVEWQNWKNPVYKQVGNGFLPQMCALDLLVNCGQRQAHDFLTRSFDNGLPVVSNPELILLP